MVGINNSTYVILLIIKKIVASHLNLHSFKPTHYYLVIMIEFSLIQHVIIVATCDFKRKFIKLSTH